MANCIFINALTLYSENYTVLFKWYKDFTGWQDSAITRLIFICYMEPSPWLTPPTPQRIPAPQLDQVAEEPPVEISPELSTSIEDQLSDSNTPVHQVQPLLGTTHTENLQLRDRN